MKTVSEVLEDFFELFEEMGLKGLKVQDDDGNIVGVIVGKDEFIQTFDSIESLSNSKVVH